MDNSSKLPREKWNAEQVLEVGADGAGDPAQMELHRSELYSCKQWEP